MGRRSKIKARDLVQSFPLLHKISQAKSKDVRKLIGSAEQKQKDLLCRCVELGLRNLSEKKFSPAQLKKMYAVEEKLNFLSSYAKCSGAKRKCLYHQQNKNIVQSGQGIGILLSAILPIIANLILKHV